MSFAGKVVIVTGASSGIGAAAAELFAKEAASVVLVGRNQTKLANVEKKLPANAKFLTINADVSTSAKKIIDDTIKKFGKIDVLINNAGFAKPGGLSDGKFLEAYDAIMSVNFRAVAELTMLALPHLKKTKGNIINISSIASMVLPVEGAHLPYHISKAALDHFTRGTAKEFAPFGIRVNSINPGPVSTDFFKNAGSPVSSEDFKPYTALNRVSTGEEIADQILYLAGEKARGITGSIFLHDNGFLCK